MKKPKNETKNQHYVPQFYLKNFGSVITSGKKDKYLISTYRFNTDTYNSDIPIKSICYEDYFYGEDQEKENELKVMESKWAEQIRQIINGEFHLNDNAKHILKEFMIYQMVRTLGSFNHINSSMKSAISSHLLEITSTISESSMQEMVENHFKGKVDGSVLLTDTSDVLEAIQDLSIAVITFNTTEKLIISDVPVIVKNYFIPQSLGLCSVGVLVFLPISPNVMLVFFDDKIYDIDEYVNIENENDVICLNNYQILNSENMVMSKHSCELEPYCSDEKLICERNDIIENYRLKDCDLYGETVYMFKSRCSYRLFDVSFIKIFKLARKVPIKSREPCKRTSSYKERIKLLVNVYRMPDILIKADTSLTKYDAKRICSENKKMQQFMDDYWNVPISERTITPDLMYKLKTVPINIHNIAEK